MINTDQLKRQIEQEEKLKKIRVKLKYQRKGRFIPTYIYVTLKRKTRCQHCNLLFLPGQMPEIHHITPISQGGTNTEKNLVALCKTCHKIADKQEKATYGQNY